MTRKEKEDFIENKMLNTDNAFQEIEKHLESLQDILEQKASEELIAELRYDKVSKSDFVDHIPDYLSPEALDNRIREISDISANRVGSEFNSLREQVDKKMVKIRQEFDMSVLRK